MNTKNMISYRTIFAFLSFRTSKKINEHDTENKSIRTWNEMQDTKTRIEWKSIAIVARWTHEQTNSTHDDLCFFYASIDTFNS